MDAEQSIHSGGNGLTTGTARTSAVPIGAHAAAGADAPGARSRVLYRLGYWLPCGQANFHRPGAVDKRPESGDGRSYQLASVPGVGPEQQSPLADDLYNRLAYTLTGENGPCVPVHLVKRDSQGRIRAAVFTVDALNRSRSPSCRILDKIGIRHALIYADDYGFMAIIADVRDTTVDGDIQKEVAAFLLSISAADPGSDDRYLSLRNDRDGLNDLLIRYANGGTFLNFFQLNTILEGLWNSALMPEVFFEQDISSGVRKRSLYTFFELIATDLKRQSDPDALAIFDRIAGSVAAPEDLDSLIDDQDRVLIVDNFLEATLKDVLLDLKWSIETTRRAFLDKTLGILHRRSLLYQIEDPCSPGLALRGVNEVQLRGYLMLVSAKLPLIMNVARYVKEVLSLLVPEEKIIGNGLNNQLAQLSGTWTALLEAIKENVTSLEHAIEASWRDRLLYEEEQSRAEQEALAEIERSRSRAIAGGSEESLVVKLTLAATLAAVAFAVWTATYHNHTGWTGGLIFVIAALAASYLMVTIFYTAKVRIKPPLRHNYEINFRLDRPIEGQERRSLLLSHDSEFALSADRGNRRQEETGRWWRCEVTNDLIATGTPEKPTVRRMSNDRWPCCLGIEKVGAGSFRIERVDDAECVIKVHCDAEVVWRRLNSTEHIWQRIICRIAPQRTALDVIAEILVHRPTAGDEVLLREVRGISVGRRRLTPRDMWEMTAALTQRFINPYLKNAHAIQTSVSPKAEDEVDASVRLIAPGQAQNSRKTGKIS